MRQTNSLKLLLLTACIIFVANPAQAQGLDGFNFPTQGEEEEEKVIWSYDKKYRPEANKLPEDPQTLLSNSEFTMHFVRSNDAGPDEAVLRFSQPVSTTGCVTVIPPTIEKMNMGVILRVTIGTPAITLDKSVRYAHIDCRQAPNNVESDVVLNRKEIAENGIRRIQFRNDFGIEDYDIELGENMLALRAKSKPALFKPNTQIRHKDPMVHYFYPKDTVVLSVPQARSVQEVEDQIKGIATQRGLIPLKSVVKDFRVLDKSRKNFYFVDQSGTTTANLEPGQSNRFGKAVIKETYFGPSGEYTEDLAIDIFARLPGTLD